MLAGKPRSLKSLSNTVKAKSSLVEERASLAQQITAGMIGDSERVAIVTITQQELAFVIGAPQFIGKLA
jgi:hypothetical protein